jgi:FkbM family methyltransferase
MNLELWRRNIGVRILRRLRPKRTLTIGQRRVRLDLRDHVIATSLYLSRDWEPRFAGLVRKLDIRSGTCADVGANIGWQTLQLSERVGPEGKVFAFEPDSRNFCLLAESLRLNAVTNVIAKRIAIGETDGQCLLWRNRWNFGDHRVVSERKEGEQYESVPLRSLDSALATVPSDGVRLVKIDTQGSELAVLRGMTATLERNPEIILIVEVSPSLLTKAGASATELVKSLRDLGFSGWELHENRVIPLLDPESYEYMDEHAGPDLVLSRSPEVLRSLARQIQFWRS